MVNLFIDISFGYSCEEYFRYFGPERQDELVKGESAKSA